MSLRNYLLFLGLSTVLCWASWYTVVTRVSPTVAGAWGPFFFYLAAFFALSGTGALVGFAIRSWISKQEAPYKLVAISFRQGILFAVVAVAALSLQAGRLLQWWSLALLVLVAASIEALVRSGSEHRNV